MTILPNDFLPEKNLQNLIYQITIFWNNFLNETNFFRIHITTGHFSESDLPITIFWN